MDLSKETSNSDEGIKGAPAVGLLFTLQSDNEINNILGNEKHNQMISGSTENQETDLKEYQIQEKRSVYQRMFGKIGPGSIRGSIFNMAILSLGSGCLNLPQKFGRMSVLMGLIDVLFAGLAAYLTLNLMIISSHKSKIYDYSRLVRNLYGRWLSWVLDITMLIYIFGIMILYQVISILLLHNI
jgi:hypothetical protein